MRCAVVDPTETDPCAHRLHAGDNLLGRFGSGGRQSRQVACVQRPAARDRSRLKYPSHRARHLTAVASMLRHTTDPVVGPPPGPRRASSYRHFLRDPPAHPALRRFGMRERG